MDKLNASTGELWLPYILVMAVVAAGLTGGSRAPSTGRPPGADSAVVTPAEQNIPARLWQDPLEATDNVRSALRRGTKTSEEAFVTGEMAPMATVIASHATKDGVAQPDGTVNYLAEFHRVLFLFVALPSDAYPEAAEQRIRARFALVSALSTAGYRPDNAQRLGLAHWDLSKCTGQSAYPFEVFKLDTDRRPLESVRLPGKFDEAVVFYVEENAIQSDQQLQWLKELSALLAKNSPPARFTDPRFPHLKARYLGPFTSDRLLALLRSAEAEAKSKALPAPVPPAILDAMPIRVLAQRPRIEASILREIVHPSNAKPPTEPAFQRLVEALTTTPREIPLATYGAEGPSSPWIHVVRTGFDDAMLAEATVRELKLRLPRLLPPVRTTSPAVSPSPAPKKRARLVLIGEWDTIYGRALPRSFEVAFRRAGGEESQMMHFTYLRGLDGQISGSLDKLKPEATKLNGEPLDLLRQLLVSRAPGVAYGRTQVDYIDRLAAHLQTEQRAKPDEPIQAIGILGTDTFDKLLILRSLRKIFPGVQYFTTELDAALASPDQYEATRNLLVASGFDLRMTQDHQRSILPFRDSGQASIYHATLLATEYSTMKNTIGMVRRPVRSWLPAVYEIGRGGPYLLRSTLPAGTLVDAAEKANIHSPLPDPLENRRHRWRAWLSPLLASSIVLLSTLSHYGRLAMKRTISTLARTGRALFHLLTMRSGLSGFARLARRVHHDIETWLLLGGACFFITVSAIIPWIEAQPDQEPFSLTEGISSWPATWLRALAVFLGAAYFWIINCHFREALMSGQRSLQRALPWLDSKGREAFPPWRAWRRFCGRTSGWAMKVAIVGSWMLYMFLASQLFLHLDQPAPVTRGITSLYIEKIVLFSAVFSMNLLIVYAVAHNISCSFFVRQVADWLRSPHCAGAEHRPLHTVLMRVIGRVAGAMTQMIYYPFTLLFLLLAARQPLFDNFDWPLALVIVSLLGSGALLASTLVLRRSADLARRQAVGWLERKVATVKWEMASTSGNAPVAEDRQLLAQAEWQLAQVNSLGGAALSEGVFSNPLLRAVLIPLGGSGMLQIMEMAGKMF